MRPCGKWPTNCGYCLLSPWKKHHFPCRMRRTLQHFLEHIWKCCSLRLKTRTSAKSFKRKHNWITSVIAHILQNTFMLCLSPTIHFIINVSMYCCISNSLMILAVARWCYACLLVRVVTGRLLVSYASASGNFWNSERWNDLKAAWGQPHIPRWERALGQQRDC